MKISIDNAVQTLVEGMLPRGSEGKALFVEISAQYMVHFPDDICEIRCAKLESELTDEQRKEMENDYDGWWVAEQYFKEGRYIEKHVTLSYIFYRPANYTLVLFKLNPENFGINLQPAIMEKRSYHDSGWRSDGLRDLSRVHFALCDLIEQEYKEIVGGNIPENIRMTQPNFSHFRSVELIENVEMQHSSNCWKYNVQKFEEKSDDPDFEDKIVTRILPIKED